jgi:uncharacterized protein (DUF305 family)
MLAGANDVQGAPAGRRPCMPPPAARRFAALGAIATLALVPGCGGEDDPKPDAPRYDDAFVSRIVPHQHVALAIAEAGARDARRPEIRLLARRMRAMRRRAMPALDDRLRRTPAATSTLPDLGVSAQQAAEEVTPQALAASKPIDPAYLTIMTRHDQGALALVQAELRLGRDPAVKAAAQRLAAELTRELARLSRALRDLARGRAAA